MFLGSANNEWHLQNTSRTVVTLDDLEKGDIDDFFFSRTS